MEGSHGKKYVEASSKIDSTKLYTLDEAVALAKEHDIKVEKHFTVGHIINEFFEKYQIK